MNVSQTTKIVFNGREYTDTATMPPEVRRAYDQAMADAAAGYRVRGGVLLLLLAAMTVALIALLSWLGGR